MAKEEPKKEEAPAEAAPAKKGKKKLIIIIAAVVVVVLLAGVAALIIIKKKHSATGENGEAGTEEVAKKEEPKFDPHNPPVFVPLEPFTVNLQAENGEQFLQVIATLKVKDHTVEDSLKVLTPEIRHRLLMLLSSRLPSEISTPEGREELADDMKFEVNDALGFAPKRKSSYRKREPEEDPESPVKAVYFTQFMIQ